MDQPRELVLAIAASDKALHVGPADDLGAHFVGLQPGGGPPPGPGHAEFPGGGQLTELRHPQSSLWHFFDSTGRALTRAEAEHPEAHTAHEPADPTEVVDEQVILLRVARALGYFQALLDLDPRLGEIAPNQFVTEIPHPDGSLAEVMAELAPHFGILNPRVMANRGGWLHRMAHKAGVAH